MTIKPIETRYAGFGPLVGAATISPGWTLPGMALRPDVAAAYIAARSARFEHGESG